MNVVLEKYHGLGNDYLVFDPNKNEIELNEENVKLLCNRNYGMEQRNLEGPFQTEQMKVRIWNPDGSKAEMSGNGDRICKIFKRCGVCAETKFSFSDTGRR